MTDYEQLISNLAQLKLNNFSENYQNYSMEVDQQRLSFGEALLKLTESELQYRRDQEIKKRIQQAKFPIVKRIGEFDFNFQPSINKQEILELKSLGFLNNH